LESYALLSEVVRAGRSAFDLRHGRSFYDYIAEEPILGPVFHGMMTDFTEQELAAIVDAYDFSHARRVVDVGGGHGGLVMVLLKIYPGLTGIVFDLAKPVDEALTEIRNARLEARIAFEAGDFFQGVPEGGDIYLLKSIIHNWQDDEAIRILRSISAAMSPNGRLLIVERVIPQGNSASEAKLFDINMMVTTGGLERTEAEHQQLLSSAGLSLTRVIPTRSYMSLIEVSKL
jgi:cyclopropane fatty-acyl-phospholipid synthase-like methyltransferase